MLVLCGWMLCVLRFVVESNDRQYTKYWTSLPFMCCLFKKIGNGTVTTNRNSQSAQHCFCVFQLHFQSWTFFKLLQLYYLIQLACTGNWYQYVLHTRLKNSVASKCQLSFNEKLNSSIRIRALMFVCDWSSALYVLAWQQQ